MLPAPYPGAERNVVDASFCLITDGVQHNLRPSRHLPAEEWASGAPPETRCGPITVEVVEPLETVRLIVQATDETGGIAADVLVTARTKPVREPSFKTYVGGHKMEYTRFTQLVEWEGSVTVPGGPTISGACGTGAGVSEP